MGIKKRLKFLNIFTNSEAEGAQNGKKTKNVVCTKLNPITGYVSYCKIVKKIVPC